MSRWRVEVSPMEPLSVLGQLTALASEWPGDDELELAVGDREFVVPMQDCPQTRRQVIEIVRRV